jgi:hypothetical protein
LVADHIGVVVLITVTLFSIRADLDGGKDVGHCLLTHCQQIGLIFAWLCVIRAVLSNEVINRCGVVREHRAIAHVDDAGCTIQATRWGVDASC